ncbi:GTPase IMAP family member 8-like [Polymixia lowei]
MAARELSTWEDWRTSHVKIVLLGGRNSGKSSVGNLILGKEEFVTRERTTCSRRLGVVAGRWVTVVDTPGWWCDFSTQDTPELVKREIMSSVPLCLPGPHAFLIVVKASSFFSRKRQRSLEEHLALLGERVWSRCIVLFTWVDWPTRTRVEEHVHRGGGALQWLSDKCSQRCHHFVFRRDTVGTQVTELLVKIQRLVTENGNRPFEMQESILQVIAEKTRTAGDRARQRFMKVKERRSLLREEPQHLPGIRIVLVGAHGSGKSLAVKTILGRGGSQVFRRTAQCTAEQGCVFGRQVTVIDTPGWWMNYFTKQSPVFDQREIVRGFSLCPPGPHALLLVVRVDRAFTETYRRAVQQHLELISETIWTHVILLFNFGDWLGDTTVEQLIESEGEPLRWLVEKCGDRYHVLNNKTRGDGFQVRELMGKIEEMVASNSGRHYEIAGHVMQRLEEKMRTEKERAEERRLMKNKQRQVARSRLEKINPLSELRIVLMGGRNTGKSSSGNTILGRERFDTENQTNRCVERRGTVRGKTVWVLDTPGRLSVNPDLLMNPSTSGLAAFLLVVNVSSSFTCSLGEALEKHLEALGEEVRSRVMVLFSHGDWLGDTDIEQRIESEGDPLRGLVERCGNRYHVLDNTNRGDGAQVYELLDQIEEMLVEERLAILQRGDQVGKSIALAHGLLLDGGTRPKQNLRVATSQLSHNNTCGQEVAVPGTTGGRAASGRSILVRDSFLSSLASVLRGSEGLRRAAGGSRIVMVNVPDWFPAGDPHSQASLNGKRQAHPFSPRHQAVVLVLPAEPPQTQHRALTEEKEDIVEVHSLCHPRLRERTLKKLTGSGGLQALIDQWGTSNLEELENFIDSYFEMVWEQAMRSVTAEHDCQTSEIPEVDAVVEEPGQDALTSIDKKLSKLDLLEEIQSDIVQLRLSLEQSLKTIQGLSEKSTAKENPIQEN